VQSALSRLIDFHCNSGLFFDCVVSCKIQALSAGNWNFPAAGCYKLLTTTCERGSKAYLASKYLVKIFSGLLIICGRWQQEKKVPRSEGSNDAISRESLNLNLP